MGHVQFNVAVEPVELAAPFRISGFVFERQELVVVTLRDGSVVLGEVGPGAHRDHAYVHGQES